MIIIKNYLWTNEDDNAMNQMESTVKQQKHKSQILAKYSEVSDEEIDYGEEQETNDNDLFQSTKCTNC